MNKYNKTKRNKTKRRRKTKNNFINKRRKIQKNHNKRKNTMKGGDRGKPKPYSIPDPNPKPGPIPPPPPPPPKPEPVQNLKLISRYEDIQSPKLYMLVGSDDLLYLYNNVKNWKEVITKDVEEDNINFLVEKNDPNLDCEIQVRKDILDYFDGDDYDNWWFSLEQDILTYRVHLFDNPNYLCAPNGQWGRLIFDLYEPSFNYINSIYNVYELDEWPTFLPPPPIRKSNEFSILEECSEEYIKQNKNKTECNQRCCGWPHSGYVCGEVENDYTPGLSHGSCVEERAKIPSTYYG